jgi:hypothetical protein
MAFYQLIKTQKLPVTIREIWSFISAPDNLKEISFSKYLISEQLL